MMRTEEGAIVGFYVPPHWPAGQVRFGLTNVSFGYVKTVETRGNSLSNPALARVKKSLGELAHELYQLSLSFLRVAGR